MPTVSARYARGATVQKTTVPSTSGSSMANTIRHARGNGAIPSSEADVPDMRSHSLQVSHPTMHEARGRGKPGSRRLRGALTTPGGQSTLEERRSRDGEDI